MSIFRLHGVHLKHRKNTARMAPERMPIPSTVVIPMSMHIGAPASLVLKAGDTVKVGQLIGESAGFVSSPVYSGVSGTVKKIDEIVAASGANIRTVIIETDGKQEILETITPPSVSNREEFLAAMRNSGIVGLGGAGFPTTVKLDADVSKIDAIVINGAECEPYITSDTRTMLDDAEYVAEGIRMLMKYLEVNTAILGIEKNKPECIAKMREALSDVEGAQVKALPSVYPQGGEKVLVYHTLGRVIREGELPLNQGVIVINCTTVATIAKYIKTGMPLVEKCITVDGTAVREPKNVIAPIGTSLRDIFEFCGGFKETPRKVIFGGPMMGWAAVDLDAPVTKQTNAVLAFGAKEAVLPRSTDCIKCGKCAASCPFSLSPCDIAAAYDAGDAERLEKLKVNICMECGCCSYVCPAKRNIVQKNKLAKTMLRNYQMSKKEGSK
ncbi:MAG: electron transport complex subunit RsxC [Clostridia bacterium]|nr:electron transport complex subunit RsxC [Clostridia bacterium]